MKEVDVFFEPYTPQVRDLAYQTRALVLRVLPGAWEKVYPNWKLIRYGASERMADLIFHVAPHSVDVDLGFYKGAALSDPQNLLHGEAKGLRHIKITTALELQSPALLALMEAAVAQAKTADL